jgi:cytochrome oxidase Cu insertion factor (SCO1/SenC/PrrC family)
MRKLLFFTAVLVALAGSVADARDHLTGIVLMAPSATTVMVHHEAFAGMPAMTMDFSIPAGTVVHPGDHIAADVDRSTEPWSLSEVHVTADAPTGKTLPPNFLNVGDHVPNLPVVDQRGRHETLAVLRGHPYALTFIYTRCQDPRMCPFVSGKLHVVQTKTAGTGDQLVEVSLDPAYDRPPVLARYGATFGADPNRWHMFTGDPRTVLDFAARFGILEHSAGPTTIVHSERLAIVDASGRITQLIDNANWQPALIISALDKLRY